MSFNNTAPLDGSPTWERCIAQWGTKWGACETQITDDNYAPFGMAQLVYTFDTAWSPPDEWFRRTADAGCFDGLSFAVMSSWEGGFNVNARFTWVHGEGMQEEYCDDPEYIEGTEDEDSHYAGYSDADIGEHNGMGEYNGVYYGSHEDVVFDMVADFEQKRSELRTFLLIAARTPRLLPADLIACTEAFIVPTTEQGPVGCPCGEWEDDSDDVPAGAGHGGLLGQRVGEASHPGPASLGSSVPTELWRDVHSSLSVRESSLLGRTCKALHVLHVVHIEAVTRAAVVFQKFRRGQLTRRWYLEATTGGQGWVSDITGAPLLGGAPAGLRPGWTVMRSSTPSS